MESVEELIFDYLTTNYFNGSIEVGLKLSKIPGDNIFQKISNLQTGLQTIEKKYGAKLAEEWVIPLYLNHKYEMVEFILDMTRCKIDDDENLIPLEII